MDAPISRYQTELLARARARIARSRVQYGDKVAYPDDMQLMLDLIGQIESLTSAMEMEGVASRERARLDWLQGRIVDTIYLDDGKIVDVRGEDLRKAIDAAMTRWPTSLEDDEGEEKLRLAAAQNQ